MASPSAGPGQDPGASAPLGTCFMAVSGPDGTHAIAQHFPGERTAVQARTTSWALDFLRRTMLA